MLLHFAALCHMALSKHQSHQPGPLLPGDHGIQLCLWLSLCCSCGCWTQRRHPCL